LNLKCTHIT